MPIKVIQSILRGMEKFLCNKIFRLEFFLEGFKTLDWIQKQIQSQIQSLKYESSVGLLPLFRTVICQILGS